MLKSALIFALFIGIIRAQSDPYCLQPPYDLVYVVDESGSIGATNFAKVRKAIHDTINDYDIGPADTQTHVGIVTFDDVAHLQFNLAQYTDKTALLSAVDSISYNGGGTNIYNGMMGALNQIFGQAGDRATVPDIMVVVTDGQDNSTVTTAQALAQSRGITVWAVGVGPDVSYDQLVQVAGTPLRVRNTTNFDFLKNTLQNIPCQQQTCTKSCSANPDEGCPRARCLDKYAQCAGWAKLGYCTQNPDMAEKMERDCPVSCKYCKEICADYDCTQECAKKALAGECTSNPEYMLVRCKKTCQYCDRCANLHTACPYQAASCTDNAQIPNLYFYCRPTCGQCTQVTNCSILDTTTQKCPRDMVYSPITNKCYWTTNALDLRPNVQATCAAGGGNLVSIHGPNDNSQFTTFLPNPAQIFYFIGLYRPSNQNWIVGRAWQDGSIVNYTYWDTIAGQPSGIVNEYNSAILLGTVNPLENGMWHDVSTADKYPGFCQRDVCPITTTTASTTVTTTTLP